MTTHTGRHDMNGPQRAGRDEDLRHRAGRRPLFGIENTMTWATMSRTRQDDDDD